MWNSFRKQRFGSVSDLHKEITKTSALLSMLLIHSSQIFHPNIGKTDVRSSFFYLNYWVRNNIWILNKFADWMLEIKIKLKYCEYLMGMWQYMGLSVFCEEITLWLSELIKWMFLSLFYYFLNWIFYLKLKTTETKISKSSL